MRDRGGMKEGMDTERNGVSDTRRDRGSYRWRDKKSEEFRDRIEGGSKNVELRSF